MQGQNGARLPPACREQAAEEVLYALLRQAAMRGHDPRSRPTQAKIHHSRHSGKSRNLPSVIPAKAGIYPPSFRRKPESS